MLRRLAFTLAAAALAGTIGYAQQIPFDRLPSSQLEVLPPAQRVSGLPGAMTIRTTSCPAHPDAQVRRRIVDIAVQEWAYFGFTVVDQTRPRPRAEAPR